MEGPAKRVAEHLDRHRDSETPNPKTALTVRELRNIQRFAIEEARKIKKTASGEFEVVEPPDDSA